MHKTKSISTFAGHRALSTAAIATLACIAPALAGTSTDPNTGQQMLTISVSGSTALKGFVTTGGFSYLEPGTTINLSTGVFGPGTALNPSDSWKTYDSNNNPTGGNVVTFQLAPKNVTSGDVTGASASADALRIEYHESGSVEGILEMANDQIGSVNYVENNIDRNPNGGNAVWVNGNQFGGVGGTLTVGSNSNGSYLGPAYGTNAAGNEITYGPGVEPTFNLAGQNVSNVSNGSYTQAGQNAVQVAVSDVVPQQAFQNNYSATSTASAHPWNSTPNNYGYGMGNQNISSGGLGVSKGSVILQSPTILNMPATAINPRTGATFGTGPWNSAGLGNLNSQQLAVTATLFVANPGTGLDRLNQTDAQWLQTTGRLQNGAVFDMTTRDVNSGTRNVAALNTGIDPSWATGTNDNGNGNLANVNSQVTIGSGMRFSNKTAGGAQLRPTVQNARMAIGTLSAGDAYGTLGATDGASSPYSNTGLALRGLEYSASADGSTPYVLPSAQNIVTGNYAIYQNEQLVTLKAPTAADSTTSVANWSTLQTGTGTGQVAIQGDDAHGDVAAVVANAVNSVTGFNSQNSGSQQYQQLINDLGTGSFALITKGFVLPQFMQVEKPLDGLNTSSSNASYDPSLSADFLNTANGFTKYTTAANPDDVYANSSDAYGHASGTTVASGLSGSNQILLTSSNQSNGTYAGGNWLFGNFNQNGIRDFDSVVVTATKALGVLEGSGLGNSSLTQTTGTNNSKVPASAGGFTLPSSLASMAGSDGTTGATKGDLIVMGDFDGRGVFDGRSLYEMAIGASLSNTAPVVSGSSVTNDHVVLGTQNETVENASGSTSTITQQTFGDALRTATLYKNTALDYLAANSTSQMKQEAAQILTVASGTTAASIPAGSTFTGNDAVTGLAQFTYDPTGSNAFNKSDVNQDGVVDFNDAVVVDNSNGLSYTNQSNALTATEQAPVTGQSQLANLVLVQQIDGESAISSADLGVVNQAFTGSGTTNWYGFAVNKTGPGTIAWQRSAGVVNVTAGASFQISAGTVQVKSAIDPFTDSTATGTDTSKSLAISVNGTGSTLEYTGTFTTGIQVDKLLSLNVSNNASVSVDYSANHSARTLVIVGGLLLDSTSKLDLHNNDLIVQNGSLSTITASIKSGLTGNGITSSTAANDSTHLTTLGVITNGTMFTAGHPFDGVTPGAADVLVKDTYFGDANLSGTVDSADYTAIDAGYLSQTSAHPLTGWGNGDFNYDGVINGSDYTLIDNAFNTQGASLAASVAPNASIAAEIAPVTGGTTSAVPEPTALGLLGVGVGSLLGRRRRRA